MRYSRFSISYAAAVAISCLVAAFDAFFRAVFRVDTGTAWRFVAHVVTNFREIGNLKPVYRDSYRTHGLSLADGRMRT